MFWLAVLIISRLAVARDMQAVTAQNNTWNSTFTLTDDQISRAGLDKVTAENVNIAVRFEQTNWAGSSAANDPFYTPPANSSTSPPGSLLSVEHYTNTTLYTLPPNTAMSRILFQSETANGTAVPASAYVLWPWMPRTDPETGRLAVVGWGHGTSGSFGECAPSHIRNLWYQYSAPYVLALQGYVVVAPDYAGLSSSTATQDIKRDTIDHFHRSWRYSHCRRRKHQTCLFRSGCFSKRSIPFSQGSTACFS